MSITQQVYVNFAVNEERTTFGIFTFYKPQNELKRKIEMFPKIMNFIHSHLL